MYPLSLLMIAPRASGEDWSAAQSSGALKVQVSPAALLKIQPMGVASQDLQGRQSIAVRVSAKVRLNAGSAAEIRLVELDPSLVVAELIPAGESKDAGPLLQPESANSRVLARLLHSGSYSMTLVLRQTKTETQDLTPLRLILDSTDATLPAAAAGIQIHSAVKSVETQAGGHTRTEGL